MDQAQPNNRRIFNHGPVFQEDDDIPSESSATKQALVSGSLVLVLEQSGCCS